MSQITRDEHKLMALYGFWGLLSVNKYSDHKSPRHSGRECRNPVYREVNVNNPAKMTKIEQKNEQFGHF